MNCPFFYPRPILLYYWVLSPSAYIKDFTSFTLFSVLNYQFPCLLDHFYQHRNTVLSFILKNKTKTLSWHCIPLLSLLYSISKGLSILSVSVLSPILCWSHYNQLLSPLLLWSHAYEGYQQLLHCQILLFKVLTLFSNIWYS